MANEINGLPPSQPHVTGHGPSQSGQVRPEGNPAQQTPQGGKAAEGDKVSLTSTAQQLQELSNQAAKASPVDSEKVSQVRDALANGKYEINADRVAEKMISLEKAIGDMR